MRTERRPERSDGFIICCGVRNVDRTHLASTLRIVVVPVYRKYRDPDIIIGVLVVDSRKATKFRSG